MKKDIEFQSKGTTCRGWHFTPDEGEGPFPTVVMAGGWCYVKEIVMPFYAERMIAQGIAVVLFDYRYFGSSDGEPRQHADPWQQIEDYRNAISYAETLEETDVDRIAVWGISYSGSHVFVLAASDPRIKAMVSVVPLIDGEMNLLRQHGGEHFGRLRDFLSAERKKRFDDPSHVGKIPFSTDDPENVVSTFPAKDVYDHFNHLRNTVAPAHEHWSTVESTEILLTYKVAPYAPLILNVPSCVIIAEGDNRTPWDLQVQAFNLIATPKRELVVQPNVTHMEMYSETSQLELAALASARWMKRHLIDLYEDRTGLSRSLGVRVDPAND